MPGSETYEFLRVCDKAVDAYYEGYRIESGYLVDQDIYLKISWNLIALRKFTSVQKMLEKDLNQYPDSIDLKNVLNDVLQQNWFNWFTKY
jgi:hypothetical protein